MEFNDFLRNFDYLDICHRNPNFFRKDESARWKTLITHCAWVVGVNNGGSPKTASTYLYIFFRNFLMQCTFCEMPLIICHAFRFMIIFKSRISKSFIFNSFFLEVYQKILLPTIPQLFFSKVFFFPSLFPTLFSFLCEPFQHCGLLVQSVKCISLT